MDRRIVVLIVMLALWTAQLAEVVGAADPDTGDADNPMFDMPPDDWLDEFIDDSRMTERRGINVTQGRVELDLSDSNRGGSNYEPYPPIIVSIKDDVYVFRPNKSLDGYHYDTSWSANDPKSFYFEDLNKDGHLDMVIVRGFKTGVPGTYLESEIRWGDGSGTWSAVGAHKFAAAGFRRAASGDFNGDGWPDLVFVNYDSSGGERNHFVFLNNGDGTFDYTQDVKLPTPPSPYCWGVAAGDLNNDGYDDIVISQDAQNPCGYYGGPNGPDATPDLTFERIGNGGHRVRIRDVNRDGYQDVLFAGYGHLYLGSKDGIDVDDYQAFGLRSTDCGVGDFNMDGYTDLLFEEPLNSLRIYLGAADGWDRERNHNITNLSGNVQFFEVLDIDKDGADDIMMHSPGALNLIYGGKDLPGSPNQIITMQNTDWSWDCRPIVRSTVDFGYHGSFTTETITLPDGKRWDILDLVGTLPENTSMSLSVLNDTLVPMEGFQRLSDWNVDLSGLEDHRTIHVRVDLYSRSNASAPTLDRLLVNWIGPTTWREQFYGEAKIERLSGLELRDGELRRSSGTSGAMSGSYLGMAFGPEDLRDADRFHTLRYNARLGTAQSGRVQLIDNVTSEVIAEAQVQAGDNEWDLRDAFSLREHPIIQVQVIVEGLDEPGEFTMDDLWVNWTVRARRAPEVLDLRLSSSSVHRGEPVKLHVTVSDEYDVIEDLFVRVQHILDDTGGWRDYLVRAEEFSMGCWTFDVTPRINDPVGVYRFRVKVTDLDGNHSGFIEFPDKLEVLPNLPSAPLSLIASAGVGTVELEWDYPATWGDEILSGHRILRGLDGTSLSPIATVELPTKRYTDADVTNGVTYSYGVVAFISVGEGPMSEVVKATPIGPPTSPRHLVAEAGDGEVRLGWEPPTEDGGSPVLGYRVFRGLNEFFMDPLGDVEGTSFVDTGLENGVPLCYAVCARNLLGDGAWSARVTATPLALPGAPVEVAAKAGNCTVRLEWHAPLDTGGLEVTHYIVYRGTTESGLATIAEVDRGTLAFSDEGVVGGRSYRYAVSAVTSMGEGPRSVTVTATPCGLPGVPIGLTAIPENGGVSLSWSPPLSDGARPIIAYVLLRGPSMDDLREVFQLENVTSCIQQGLHGGRTYYYAVAARNELGRGDFTAPVPVNLPAPPERPSRVVDISGTVEGGKVIVAWLPPEDNGGAPILGYALMRGKTPTEMRLLTELGDQLSYIDEVPEGGRTYYYSVVARNTVGQGEVSETISVLVPRETHEEPGFGAGAMALATITASMVVIASRNGRRRRGGL